MSDLETTSHVLSSYVATMSDIEDDALEGIKKLAQEIIALATEDESLDADARAAILRYASRIVVAADLYKVTGPQALIDELDRFYSEQKRIQPATSAPLKQKLGRLVGAIVVAVELFGAPVNVANAIEYYGGAFELTQLTEAPAAPDDEVVIAEAEDDEPEGAEGGEQVA
jgi:hypothetical protein